MPFRIRRQGVTRMPDALNGSSAAQADFDLSSTNFVFNAVEGDPDPSPQFLLVANVGTGTFAGPTLGTPIYLSGSGWMAVTAAGGLPGSATISVTTGSLTAGVYSARFYVTDSNTVDSPAMVGVTFVVAAAPQPPILSVGGSSFVFTASVGDPNTAVQQLTVSNIGGGSFAGPAVGNVVYGPGATGWLAGSINGLTISGFARPAGISSGNYTATFDVTDTNASNTPLTVPVAFNVSASAPATMSFSPGLQLNFTAVQGGANPATQQAIITNVGGGTLAAAAAGAITYQSGSGWITSITFGGSGNSQTMTILLATGALTPATYTATFPVTSAGASNSPQTFTVSFVVTAVTPPGNFPAPKYTLMQGVTNATFNTNDNTITYNPFTNNGLTDPDGDPASPGYYYAGATALTASSLANLNTHTATAAANPTTKYVITLDTSFSTGTRWTLPAKDGTLFTLIKGSVALPTAEVDRPVAADFASAKKITYTGTNFAVAHAAGSDGWHIRDLYVENGSSSALDCLWYWGFPDDAGNSGNGQRTEAEMPERFKMERCYLNNPFDNSTKYCSRILTMSGRYAIVRRNRIEGGCKNASSDSQGILIANGIGDYQIEDNFIEGASENILSGGGRNWMTGVTTYGYNIHIRGNHLYKRPAWLTNVAGPFGGSTVYAQIKHLFELKYGRYVVFEDNYLENHNGVGEISDINLKVSPYTTSEATFLRTNDITIRNNFSTNGCASFDLAAGDQHTGFPSTALPVGRWEIRNNAFVSRFTQSSQTLKNNLGGLASVNNVMSDITLDHNFFSDTNSFIYFTPNPAVCITSLFVTNNIWFNAINPTQSSVLGTGVSPNKAALDAFCSTTGWTFSKNAGVSTAGQTQLYGSGASGLASAPYRNKWFASSGTPGTGAVNSGPLGADLNSDRTVKQGSTKLAIAAGGGGTDGKDIGPDWTQLVKAMSANT